MKVVFLICFAFTSIFTFSQSRFIKNHYVAGISPNKLLNQLNYMDYFFSEIEEIKVSSDYVKTHKIKSITEKKIITLENNKNKPYDTTFKKTYFDKNGFPTRIEKRILRKKALEQYCEFEYDEKDNLVMFRAYNNFWMIQHRNLTTEIIIKNEFIQDLLVHQNIKFIYSTYRFNKRLIDRSEVVYFHDLTYSLDDSMNIVTVYNDFDTLFRKAHIDIIYQSPSELNCNNQNFSRINRDTLLCDFFSESDFWALKRVFNKEYDSLGYLIKMNATVYKENSLENYDTLKYYFINSIDTINEICPFFYIEVATKGSSSMSNHDSTKIYPKYTSDTINVQYQFYYMDDINYSNSSKIILGYYLYNDKGKKIDQYEGNSRYCKNFYNEKGLIDKQIFTLSPFWDNPKDNKWNCRRWDSVFCIIFNIEHY